jgi:hypothetical protein
VEISRKKLRDEVLKRIKYVKTCVMARELCLLVRSNRAVLEPEDVQEICGYIAKLCREEGCVEPSELCEKAAEAIGAKDEKRYLELCAKSCVKCGEAKRPTSKKNEYVA